MFRCTLATLLVITLFCTHAEGESPIDLDRRMSRILEGDNSLLALDYFMEALALGSPIIDYSTTFDLWYPAQNSIYPNSSRLSTSAILATYALTGFIKYSVRRERPQRRYQPRLWNTRITPSFPSGHAASSALFAAIYSHYHPEAKLPALAYVIASAYSQVYVGNHYLSDVMAGVLLGATLGIIMTKEDTTDENSDKLASRAPPFSLTFAFSLPSNKVK